MYVCNIQMKIEGPNVDVEKLHNLYNALEVVMFLKNCLADKST